MTTLFIIAASTALLVAVVGLVLSMRRAALVYGAQHKLSLSLESDESLRARLVASLHEVSKLPLDSNDPERRREIDERRREFEALFREVIERLPEAERKFLRELEEQSVDNQLRHAQRLVA